MLLQEHKFNYLCIVTMMLCPAPEGIEGHYKMGRGVCPSVCLSVCPVPRHNSRTERPMKPKIGRMEAHHMINP